MPILSTTLQAGAATPTTKPLIRALKEELLLLGAELPPSEMSSVDFNAPTTAALKKFQEWMGLSSSGTCDPLLGKITLAYSAAVRSEGASVASLAADLAAAASKLPALAAARLGRLLLQFGQLVHAAALLTKAAANPEAALPKQLLSPAERAGLPPDILFPENFHTYRYAPFGEDTDAIVSALRKVQLTGSKGAAIQAKRVNLGSGNSGGVGGGKPPPYDPPPDPPPPELVELDIEPAGRRATVQKAAGYALDAIEYWQLANGHYAARRFAAADLAYQWSTRSAEWYLDGYYGRRFTLPKGTQWIAAPDDTVWLRGPLAERALCLTIEELQGTDWREATAEVEDVMSWTLRGKTYKATGLSDTAKEQLARFEDARHFHWDRVLFLIVAVWGPLARAEAKRQLRQFDEALSHLNRVLERTTVFGKATGVGLLVRPVREVYPLCWSVEVPFARALLAEVLLEQAESRYQASDPPAEAARAIYKAAIDAMAQLGTYVATAQAGLQHLKDDTAAALPASVAPSPSAFRREVVLRLGKDIYVSAFSARGPGLPGARGLAAARLEPMLKEASTGAQASQEANPRIYALILTAQARIAQIEAGLNYLGYPPDYVPPWRFAYALERARYFAEHAKAAQRDHLNFLANAEREEFQELSATQSVSQEKANVAVEGARIDQAMQQVQASQESLIGATLAEQNSLKRIENYAAFDEKMRDLETSSAWFGAGVGLAFVIGGALIGGPAGASAVLAGLQTGAATAGEALFGNTKAQAQRGLEASNLVLAATEAAQSTKIADGNLKVARASLVVAALQRQVALLRHEHAVQSLQFLMGRILHAEQWYRLAEGTRVVADTYLRYAIEIAFLAEQAYEFEADKKINVIRFDYAQSELGNFLAADFLLRDLDTLEKDLIVNQRQREQHVRYVLSMFNELPEALEALRREGRVTFNLVLEQIERRFPGLFNARLASVEVLPLALLNANRFSAHLTHLGSGQVRRPRAQGAAPPELPPAMPPAQVELETQWPRSTRIMGPEAAIYSGLSRQEEASVFAFAAQGQLGAFEGRPAAGAWQLDLSSRENEIVPDTLVDVLFTFNIAGHFDEGLRGLVENAAPRLQVPTVHLSARTLFPDAYYEFTRTGRLTLEVRREHLVVAGEVQRLRNLGVLLLPAARRLTFDPLFCTFEIEFVITSAGQLKVISELPQPTFQPLPGNRLSASAVVTPGAEVSWNFGDDSSWAQGASVGHVFSRGGRHEVTLRIVRGGTLSDFRAECYVGDTAAQATPLTAAPKIKKAAGAPAGKTRVQLNSSAPKAAWRLGKGAVQQGGSVTYDLEPGTYSLSYVAQRPVTLRLHSGQRYKPDWGVALPALSVASNRAFDSDGNDTTGDRANPLAKRLFGEGEISPIDVWTTEMFVEGAPTALALSSIHDLVLVVEFEVQEKQRVPTN